LILRRVITGNYEPGTKRPDTNLLEQAASPLLAGLITIKIRHAKREKLMGFRATPIPHLRDDARLVPKADVTQSATA
jgi:hypothetical protein